MGDYVPPHIPTPGPFDEPRRVIQDGHFVVDHTTEAGVRFVPKGLLPISAPPPAAGEAHAVPLATMQLYRCLADGLMAIVEQEDGAEHLTFPAANRRWLLNMLALIQQADPAGEPGATGPIIHEGSK